MTNDNEPPTNVVGFKKKAEQSAFDSIANIFVKDDMVGLSIKDGIIFLPPEAALQMCVALSSAIQLILDKPQKDI